MFQIFKNRPTLEKWVMNMGHINFRHFVSADGLKEVFVSSYEDISARIEEGTVNRLEILNFKRTSEDQK